MKTYKFKKINAFTTGLSEGNPAAAVYLSSDLPDPVKLDTIRQNEGKKVLFDGTAAVEIDGFYYSY